MKKFIENINIVFDVVENSYETELQADIQVEKKLLNDIDLFFITTIFNYLTTPILEKFAIKSNNIKIENNSFIRVFIQKINEEGVVKEFNDLNIEYINKLLNYILKFSFAYSFYREKIIFLIAINKNIKIKDKPKIWDKFQKYTFLNDKDNIFLLNDLNVNLFTKENLNEFIEEIDKNNEVKDIKKLLFKYLKK